MRDSLGVTGDHPNMRARALIVAGLIAGRSLVAQDSLPAPVAAGLTALKAGRCNDAFKMWSEAWTAAEDVGKQQQLLAGCALLDRFGQMFGYEVIKTVNVGVSIQRLYFVLKYQAQPIYLMVVAYRPDQEWRVIGVNWHTFGDQILPADLVPNERPKP